MSTPPRDNLTILPLPEDVRRERDREERLAEQPRAVQEWFDATAEDRAMDARLRAFAANLLPALADEVEPVELEAAQATLDELEPGGDGAGQVEWREVASARRLARQPLVLQEWFDSAAEGGGQDARLRTFAAELLARELEARAEDEVAQIRPVVPLRSATAGVPTAASAGAASVARRWTRVGVAALALAAAGLLVVRALAPSPAVTGSGGPQAPLHAVAVDDGAAGLALAGPGQPVQAVPSIDPTELEALAVASGEVPIFAEEAWPSPTPAPRVDRRTAGPGATVPGQAPSPVVSGPLAQLDPTQAPPTSPAPTAALVAAAPTSPPLLSSGEIEADTSPWRGEVVDGVDLRVDKGFGVLSGTQAAPVLALSDDATVRVDVDRAAVDPAFATFTIRTVSATVRVVGTKYTVTTLGSRTEVATRRGTVQVECADGRRKLVSEGQTASCEPQPDPRLLVHMQALDRPPMLGQAALTGAEQYAHLQRQRQASTPSAFVATADVMLGRALASADLRQALEAVRVDAMCDLGWEGPARRAARAWVEGGGQVERERIERIAEEGCEAR